MGLIVGVLFAFPVLMDYRPSFDCVARNGLSFDSYLTSSCSRHSLASQRSLDT